MKRRSINGIHGLREMFGYRCPRLLRYVLATPRPRIARNDWLDVKHGTLTGESPNVRGCCCTIMSEHPNPDRTRVRLQEGDSSLRVKQWLTHSYRSGAASKNLIDFRRGAEAHIREDLTLLVIHLGPDITLKDPQHHCGPRALTPKNPHRTRRATVGEGALEPRLQSAPQAPSNPICHRSVRHAKSSVIRGRKPYGNACRATLKYTTQDQLHSVQTGGHGELLMLQPVYRTAQKRWAV